MSEQNPSSLANTTANEPSASAPDYIKPEYAALFKTLRPDDLLLPEWMHYQIQRGFNYDVSKRTAEVRKMLLACLTTPGLVRHDDDFLVELLLREEREHNARSDLVKVLKAIADKKAIPFEEQVVVTSLAVI